MNKLEFPSPKDALCQIHMFKLAQSFWRSFLNFVNVFSIFILVFVWKISIPFTHGCIMAYIWLKLAHWFWRRNFLNFADVFSLFLNFIPLELGQCPSFEQTWIPITLGCMVPILVEIGPVTLLFNFVNVFPLFRNYLP